MEVVVDNRAFPKMLNRFLLLFSIFHLGFISVRAMYCLFILEIPVPKFLFQAMFTALSFLNASLLTNAYLKRDHMGGFILNLLKLDKKLSGLPLLCFRTMLQPGL